MTPFSQTLPTALPCRSWRVTYIPYFNMLYTYYKFYGAQLHCEFPPKAWPTNQNTDPLQFRRDGTDCQNVAFIITNHLYFVFTTNK